MLRLLKHLGAGAHGTVYKALNSKNEVIAIKVLKLDPNEGLHSLLELGILYGHHSQYLLSCHQILRIEQQLLLLSELATSDLKHYHLYTISEIDHALQAILLGLNYLHRTGFIHGDVKANNVLIFGTGEIKIADFSLAAVIGARKYRVACTITHRPLEGFTEDWDWEVDIWAFACTVHEIVAHNTLFKSQKQLTSENSIQEEFQPYLQALYYFLELPVTSQFIRPRISAIFRRPEYVKYLKIMSECLQPETRPSTGALLSDYFPQASLETIWSKLPLHERVQQQTGASEAQVRRFLSKIIGPEIEMEPDEELKFLEANNFRFL